MAICTNFLSNMLALPINPNAKVEIITWRAFFVFVYYFTTNI